MPHHPRTSQYDFQRARRSRVSIGSSYSGLSPAWPNVHVYASAGCVLCVSSRAVRSCASTFTVACEGQRAKLPTMPLFGNDLRFARSNPSRANALSVHATRVCRPWPPHPRPMLSLRIWFSALACAHTASRTSCRS
eukprot:6191186-Pleurochrysis_carterae.AAC.3